MLNDRHLEKPVYSTKLMTLIIYFHQEVSEGRYPDAGRLADHFEISASTAHRDIEYMRDRLNAPLVYDRNKNGYRYDGAGFALPLEKSPAVLFLFALLSRLAKESGLISDPEIQRLQKELGSFGIFKGEPVYDIKILFTDTAADIVRNQIWHRDGGNR